jgi:hypothetical protein
MSIEQPSLAGVDAIDWHALQHAYGSADDVPDQLYRLADGDDSSIGDLFGNIYHQGSLFEATAYTVPFLWRLLAAHGEIGHSGIAALLSAIAEASGSQRNGWAQKSREEVWKGAGVALRLLSSSNETARRGAASILPGFAEYADQLTNPLRGVLRRPDCSQCERARIGLALAAMGEFEDEAFGAGDSAFFAEAKGNTEAVDTCLSVLIETIETDPEDLSNWTG